MQIVRYVIVKTSHDPRDVHWSRNALTLALETAIYCHDLSYLREMQWCLNEAYFYRLDAALLPIPLRAHALLDSSLLAVLEFLWIIKSHFDNNLDLDRSIISKLQLAELNPAQLNAIAHACLNVGQFHLCQSEYSSAFSWLKQAHNFSKSITLILCFYILMISPFLCSPELQRHSWD